MARKGRPTKMTPALVAKIANLIRLGCFPTVAARATGIEKSTFCLWMRRGRRKGYAKRYSDFFHQVDEAMAAARVVAENKVFSQAPHTWLRSGPGREDWGDKSELTVLGDAQRPIQVRQETTCNFTVDALAASQVLLKDLGIIPPLPEEHRKALMAFGQQVPEEAADPDAQQESTAMPEWRRRKAAGGRKHGLKKKKQAETKE